MAETYDERGYPGPGYGVVSKPGGREHNEDSCVVRDYCARRRPRYLCFMGVADGMGGHRAGDTASQVALQMLEQLAGPAQFSDSRDFEENVEKVIWNAFSSINSHIYDLGHGAAERRGMGTTLTCALVDRGNAHIGHVGDTRAYLVSSAGIRKLTEDHSVVGKMLSEGVISEREAQVHEKRNVLTRAIGPEPNIEIDILRVPVAPGEVLFICTDGLYTSVESSEVLQVLLTEAELQAACERLVDLAIARGSDDNVTAVAWRMPAEDMLSPAHEAGSGTGAVARLGSLPWWLVAVLAALILAIGFGVGWGAGALFRGGKTIKKTETGRPKGTGAVASSSTSTQTKGSTSTGPAEQPPAFAYGSTVKISMDSPTSLYQLREKATRNSPAVAQLPQGGRLKVIGHKPLLDEGGGQWYYVQVEDAGQAKGKTGYVMARYLVE